MQPGVHADRSTHPSRQRVSCAWRQDDGFGADPAGEGRFDSPPGLICMIPVLAKRRSESLPDDALIRNRGGRMPGRCPQ